MVSNLYAFSVYRPGAGRTPRQHGRLTRSSAHSSAVRGTHILLDLRVGRRSNSFTVSKSRYSFLLYFVGVSLSPNTNWWLTRIEPGGGSRLESLRPSVQVQFLHFCSFTRIKSMYCSFFFINAVSKSSTVQMSLLFVPCFKMLNFLLASCFLCDRHRLRQVYR